jgi:putative alpha-1,2-mannosidase
VDDENTGGFSTDGSNITGFSALHDSGTGDNPSLGNFPVFPIICAEDDINTCNFPIGARATPYKNDSIEARPGYFGITLESGTHADMTVSQHTALFRFDFSEASNGNASVDPVVMLDLTDLWQSRQNASISIKAEDRYETGKMKGNGTSLPSFGAGSYMAYFCSDVSGGAIKDSGIWVNDRAGMEPKELYVTRGFNLFYIQAGGFIRFQEPLSGPVLARVGLSFISTEHIECGMKMFDST